jgi:allantoate deiminase
MTDPLNYAATVLRRCDELAAFSEESGRLTRRFATPALFQAGETVRRWMEAVGMTVRRDAVGNLIGRLADGQSRTLLIGSHPDTVRDAGRYDGMLGVLVTRAFGGDPEGLASACREPTDLIGYYEVHIEQGPVLEAEGVPLGVVTAIAGQSRTHITFTGEAGHAGTVPMALRRDALCGAAEFVSAVEAFARDQDDVVATVGQLEVDPGASNVIAGRVTLSLDVRHTSDSVRKAVGTRLSEGARAIANARGLAVEWNVLQETRAVDCSTELTERVAEAVVASGHPTVRLASGAGHDAVMLSTIAPIAMLFVRCAGGVSHNPAEAVTVQDVAAAIDASTRFLELLG